MTPISAPDDVSALWLLTLQRAVARASHDVKDAMNGVSVNLEVIRSRAARPDTPASDVAKFGEAAAQQLDRLTTLLDAILTLSKADRSSADVGVTLRRVIALCGAASSMADARIQLVDESSMRSTTTRVLGDVVRLALTSPLLEVAVASHRAQRASDVTCVLSADAAAVRVVIAAPGRRALMPESIVDVVRSAGVSFTEGPQDLSLTFPSV